MVLKFKYFRPSPHPTHFDDSGSALVKILDVHGTQLHLHFVSNFITRDLPYVQYCAVDLIKVLNHHLNLNDAIFNSNHDVNKMKSITHETVLKSKVWD